jgi:hypothetical protein
MIRIRLRALTAVLALAGIVLVPAMAGAVARGFVLGGGPAPPAYFLGYYNIPSATPPFNYFPAPASWVSYYPAGTTTLPKVVPVGASPAFQRVEGTPGNGAIFYGSHPTAAQVFVSAWVWGTAWAGKNMTAASPDTVHDSLSVSVDRSVPGQVTISINGAAQHLNPAADPQPVRSKLRVVVYPDSNSAKAQTPVIAQGEMNFTGSAGTSFSGFFNAGDFTGPTVIGDGNDFQVATNGTVVKVIPVPNAATACVEAVADPNANAGVPATTPPTLALLAVILLAGGTWFLVRNRRRQLA